MRERNFLGRCSAALIGAAAAVTAAAAPSVYPTGTTIYQPDKAWNGYTVFIASDPHGVVLIDMNGNTVKQWTDFAAGAGGPARILPGGYVLAGGPVRRPHQESNALIQLDFDGNEVWRFERNERIETEDGEAFWSARAHHDWQREGSPNGYYAPGSEPLVDHGRTLLLTHTNHVQAAVTERRIEDDRLIEIDWDGNVLWEWLASEHIDELGFGDEARAVIRSAPGFSQARDSFDWFHTNAATYVGPNRWYDDGDERFHPDNVVISSRQASIIAIVARDGSIVWRLGPDYRDSEATTELRQIVGQHHPHIIPKGLPGAGNMMVFDNGGASGYGFANPVAPNGVGSFTRANSRVIEFNPVTFEEVWSYSMRGQEAFRFFSSYISSAQRLENGNTLITEGADARLFEVTAEGEIVWEYVSPYFSENNPISHTAYRAYRLPYDWVPQLPRPEERAVAPPSPGEFRLPSE